MAPEDDSSELAFRAVLGGIDFRPPIKTPGAYVRVVLNVRVWDADSVHGVEAWYNSELAVRVTTGRSRLAIERMIDASRGG